MTKYFTTLWENIKGRVEYLAKSGEARSKMEDVQIMDGNRIEVATALVEEMERLHQRIQGAEGMIMDIQEEIKEGKK